MGAHAQRVVALGAINVDERLAVHHHPGSGETVVGPRFVRGLGGKGANQAVAAARAGAPTTVLGAVGDDDEGRWALAALHADGIDTGEVRVDAALPTGRAVIAVDRHGDNLILVGLGAGLAVTAADVDAALADASPGDVLLLQLELPTALARHACAVARGRGMRVVLNTSPVPADTTEVPLGADLTVVNRGEAAALTGVRPDTDVRDLVTRLAELTGHAVVCTLGPDGVLLVEQPGGDVVAVDAVPVTAVDTTGAGDTFAGYVAAGFAHGHPLLEAVHLAVRAAAVAVTRPGALDAIPRAAELDTAPTA